MGQGGELRDPRQTGREGQDDEGLPAGARALEHTADLGLELRAPDLPALFELAGAATMALLRGDAPAPASARASIDGDGAPGEAGEAATAEGALEKRTLAFEATDAPSLLRAWLRELLFLHEMEGFAMSDARFARLTPTVLDATVCGRIEAAPPEREIKGVTHHALEAARTDEGWRAQVIFDV